MKKIVAAALAAIVATTALVGTANAQPMRWKGNWQQHQQHQMYHPGPKQWNGGNWGWRQSYDPGPAIVAGSIFAAIGALALSGDGYHAGYGGPQSHVAWCDWRYRTYNSATDTYFIRPGVPAACHSPYDY